MNIHEYQGKAVLKEFGLPVSNGVAIFSADEAEAAAKQLGGPLWVVKSQIHAGGRGKGKAKEAEDLVSKLYKAFTAKDMEMLEINPLIVTQDGHLKCLDAKISFDGNALYRHPDVQELRDITEEDDKEIEASKYDLAYITLDGTIGCMVNGAGLAMATLDIIKLYGEEPANFLDVGGGASE